MKKSLGITVFTFLVATALGCQKQADPVEKGEHLVNILDCDTCHSPKMLNANGMPVLAQGGILVPDTTRRLSGHPAEAIYPTWSPEDAQRGSVTLASRLLTAWAGPWGVSFATNLTPDKATGLGEWTEEAFVQAMRTGKHQGQPNGRYILPPMPYYAYKHLTDNEVKAIWAYLQTLPAIENEVPTPIPPSTPTRQGN
ncbi:cytochrome c [candidate division KSB1 bacterium]|nr:cytochrome c [candidate division KSB1 bacterium]NIR71971.1 cytochrome c [candidate division KSB1 bacterium]NIS24969.1 cytochrome c [candidate division KSB1 bacterium]NIT71889.1 cytochrome c [candidate division KSB1 bacterium]NIU25620.1 cytochrome c [candidate division KSB1 bacterium]